ncbi:hypothetical protein [Streptomyces sp. DH12]|uniref:hypothetical protein n=1 Tax=Streptomyces sp. DH12 TaxID=2857010 RepID=UPI001E3FFB43|nr:hypothetical protein [Streptomyces sp. DH12]
MSMRELVAAGAPELPPGYFYRVRSESSFGLLKVELRRQGRWFSTAVENTYVRPADYATVERAVVDACSRVVEWWGGRQADARAMEESQKFIGDHDPRGGRHG